MAILPVLFALMVLAVLVWVAWVLIQSFPSYGVPTVKMLLIAVLVLIIIFFLASILGISMPGGLRLK